MWTCPKCSEDLDDEVDVCPACFAKTWTCSKCGEQIEEGLVVCWSCGTSIDGAEDPEFFDTETGSAAPQGPDKPSTAAEEWVTVARCSMPSEAQALRVTLEAAGIPVF